MLHLNVLAQRYQSSGSGDYRLGSPPEIVGGFDGFSPSGTDLFAQYRDYEFEGWDGEDAAPITRATTDSARRFHAGLPRSLKRPDIAPGSDGTIGFQWRFDRSGGKYVKIFIEVGPGEVVRAYRNKEGEIRHWPRKAIGYGTYRIVADVFDFLNDRI